MSSNNQPPSTPAEQAPDTPTHYVPRRQELSSIFEPSSPGAMYSQAQTPGSPSRRRFPRSELATSMLGDGEGSPFAYPSTPGRNTTQRGYDSPSAATPRTGTTFVRTPLFQTPGRIGPLSSPAAGVTPGGGPAPVDTQDTDPASSMRVIWGTTVNLHDAMKLFSDFLRHFCLADRKRIHNEPIAEEDNRPFYPQLLSRVCCRVCPTEEKKKPTPRLILCFPFALDSRVSVSDRQPRLPQLARFPHHACSL